MVRKNDQNETTNHPDAGRFLDFGVFWEEMFFRRFLGPEKVGPKFGKIRHFRPRGGTEPAKWVGPAECAGPLER